MEIPFDRAFLYYLSWCQQPGVFLNFIAITLKTWLAAGVLILALGRAMAYPFPSEALPGTEIGGGLPAGYEPSGAAWHTGLSKLLLVSDGGLVSMLNADGTSVSNWSVTGDLEAISVTDPSSSFVYVGVENPDSILELNISTGVVTRTFDLTPWMSGPSNQGLEALTFLPDPGDPEGGLFYAGLQDDGKIYSFRLSISSSTTATTVTYLETITPVLGRTDLSGLHYDSNNEVLYAIFDGSDLLRAMQADGTFLAEWDLAGNDQEGVALLGDRLFIAEDVGEEVWRYSPFPILLRPPSADFDLDLDVDGADYLTWQRGFGQAGALSDGDADGSSFVDAADLEIWEQQFGAVTPLASVASVPEPTSAAILLGLVMVSLCEKTSSGRHFDLLLT